MIHEAYQFLTAKKKKRLGHLTKLREKRTNKLDFNNVKLVSV